MTTSQYQNEINRLTELVEILNEKLHAAETQVAALLDAKEVPIELKTPTHVGGVLREAGTLVAAVKLMNGMGITHLATLLSNQHADVRVENPKETADEDGV